MKKANEEGQSESLLQKAEPRVVSDEAVTFAQAFADALRAREADARLPKDLGAWERAADKMYRLDKRTVREATALANWLFNADGDAEFWRANVRSVPKFREKYETLRAQAKRGGRKRDQEADRADPTGAIRRNRARRAAASARDRAR